jgi:uncharacterized protein YraI
MRKFYRKSRLIGLALAAALLLAAFAPAPGAAAQAATAVVVSSEAAVYIAPSTGAQVLQVLPRETVVTLSGYRTIDALWAQVYLDDGTLGWMQRAHLYSDFQWGNLWVVELEYDPVEPSTLALSPWAATVKWVHLNLREGPGEAYNVIGRLSPGQIVEMLGRSTEGYWVQVRLTSGVVGWVYSRYLSATYPITYLPAAGDTRGTASAQGVTAPYIADQQGGFQATGATGGPNAYMVQTGDTLFGIALEYGLTTQVLADYNGITDASYIQVGQVIYIP